MLKKDLKLISRTPSYAIVVMLPVVESLFFVSGFDKYVSIAATATILSLMVIVSFVLFSLEDSHYTRILPINIKSIIKAKAVLATLVYVVSMIVIGVVLTFKGAPTNALFGFSQIPTAFAVSLIVLILAIKIGVRVDVYNGFMSAVVLFIPGFIISLIPLGIGLAISILYRLSFELAAFISSLVEMITAVAILNAVRLEEF